MSWGAAETCPASNNSKLGISDNWIVLWPGAGASRTIKRVTLTKREISFNPLKAVNSGASGEPQASGMLRL
ncbi:hypothetical protein CgunFtcFv8_022971 [Champsocephalus gunnari]|uniref:Uncharacterized protein n=1 Tax=Champsocephalus gunnari TaxID=52237 RepID=A0AAN8HKZ3_CHAGU|nr:hypothetical protein CgunFtcFv8_022971 [Champsocephalus gunnari]